MNQSSSWQLTCFVVVGGDGGLDTGLGQDILLLILCIHFKIRFKECVVVIRFIYAGSGGQFVLQQEKRERQRGVRLIFSVGGVLLGGLTGVSFNQSCQV